MGNKYPTQFAPSAHTLKATLSWNKLKQEESPATYSPGVASPCWLILHATWSDNLVGEQTLYQRAIQSGFSVPLLIIS